MVIGRAKKTKFCCGDEWTRRGEAGEGTNESLTWQGVSMIVKYRKILYEKGVDTQDVVEYRFGSRTGVGSPTIGKEDAIPQWVVGSVGGIV
jgi:hypothetical protein